MASDKAIATLLQASVFVPAKAVAPCSTVSIMSSVASAHGSFAFTKNVKVTVPATISSVPGVYAGLIIKLSSKVPSPEVVHSTET